MAEWYDKIVPPKSGPGRAFRGYGGSEFAPKKEEPKPQPAPPPSRPSGGSGSGGSGGSGSGGGGSAPAPRPGPGGRTPRTPRKPRQSQAGRSGGTTYSSSSGGSVTYKGGSYAEGSSSSGSSKTRSSNGSESSSNDEARARALAADVLSGDPFAGLPASSYVGPDPSSDTAPLNPHIEKWFRDMVRGAPKPTTTLPGVKTIEWKGGGEIVKADFLGSPVYVDKEIVPRLDYVNREYKARGIKYKPASIDPSFNPRPVRNGTARSAHGYGLAIDVDPGNYGLGSSKRQPQEFVNLMKDAGFAYGGDFKRRKDPHHYSLIEREGGNPGRIKAPVTRKPTPAPKIVKGKSAVESLLRGML